MVFAAPVSRFHSNSDLIVVLSIGVFIGVGVSVGIGCCGVGFGVRLSRHWLLFLRGQNIVG